ncbi:hypothetical protein PAHAL_6G254600 [Panicum hallii]|uniref:Myb/SANT-like domain-containing protein n=1 Tax=Panicum hallii TaxID=206008 RepID=A0A2T8IHI2_9POAL|nr:hypothetical protein PAHAL_6G254600 [Panicum hallii]
MNYFLYSEMAENADWNEENTRLLCELFAEQVRAHNRSGTHLNRTGYKNVMEKFKEKTELDYSKLQFKNKWDKMRKEYGNWKRLSRETGLGWDPVYKGIAKFKDGPLQHEDLKTIMFEDIRNTGDDHWSPSSGAAPNTQDTEPDDDKDEDYEANEASDDCHEISPEPSKGKRPAPTSRKDKGKNQKLQEDIGERSTASCESLARREDTSGCSIKDVMVLVRECGAVPGSKEHFIASQVFIKRAEREMFMTLETPEERFQWLTMKHNWLTRNDSTM